MFLKSLNLELENAQKYYEKSLGIIENLVQMYPEIFRCILQDKNEEDFVKELRAMGLQKQATVFMHDKNYGLAKEYLSLARDYYEGLYEKAPEKPKNWKAVCEIRILIGILHRSLENYDVAIPLYESVFPILNKHLESDPDNLEYLSIMSVLETQLGITYHSTGEYEKSKEAFEKSILLNTQILEEDPENFLNLGAAAITFTEYSKLLTDMGKEEAEEYAAKADKIKEKLDKMCGPDGVMPEDQEPGKEV